MKVKDVLAFFEEMAPLGYAEDFDNIGLLVGNLEQEVTGVLVCHDALETVIDEAVSKNCNLVLCFHPIIFSGIKKITGDNYVERSIIKAIKNDVAIYAIHTALDNHIEGVNKMICNALELVNTKILIPKRNYIRKLITFTIPENATKLRNALFLAGAGSIGNYENCSFSSTGIGTYRGNEHSNPKIGKKLELIENEEIRIEVTFEKHLETKILKALFENHVYEEVAFEIYNLENRHQNIGLGMIGELKKPMKEREFLLFVKDKMQCGIIRHSEFLEEKVKKVAVLGGSGSFAISNAIGANANVFLTSDLKYHQFYEAENKLLLADIGHFESERFIKKNIVDYLRKKSTNFAVVLSEKNTNPVKYL